MQRWTTAPALTMIAVGSLTATGVGGSSNVFDATAPSMAVPDGYQQVADDTGVLVVSVPADWQIATAPQVGPEGMITPSIIAGPVVEPPACDECHAFLASAGVELAVAPAAEVALPTAPGCDGQQVAPYDDGTFVGFAEYAVDRPGVDGNSEPDEMTTGCDIAFERVVASQPEAISIDATFLRWTPEEGAVTMPDDEAFVTFDTILSTLRWTGLPFDTATQGTWAPRLPPVSVGPEAPLIALWPYGGFTDAPQLGSEPVRGSGCGSGGEIGDTIPDGLWAGFVAPEADGTATIDLVCVYYGDSAAQVLEDATATIIDATDDAFVVVNNNDRRRTASDATTAVLFGVDDGTGACKPFESERRPGGLTADDAAYADHIAWVRIADGQLQWVFYGCSAPPTSR